MLVRCDLPGNGKTEKTAETKKGICADRPYETPGTLYENGIGGSFPNLRFAWLGRHSDDDR